MEFSREEASAILLGVMASLAILPVILESERAKDSVNSGWIVIIPLTLGLVAQGLLIIRAFYLLDILKGANCRRGSGSK